MEPEARNLLLSIVACLDLTSLDDSDGDEWMGAVWERALHPGEGLPHAAAVCVLPRFVPLVRERLTGSEVRVAAAAGAFPEGTAPLEVRVTEIRDAVAAGADEIDTVLAHRALVSGRGRDGGGGLAGC